MLPPSSYLGRLPIGSGCVVVPFPEACDWIQAGRRLRCSAHMGLSALGGITQSQHWRKMGKLFSADSQLERCKLSWMPVAATTFGKMEKQKQNLGESLTQPRHHSQNATTSEGIVGKYIAHLPYWTAKRKKPQGFKWLSQCHTTQIPRSSDS